MAGSLLDGRWTDGEGAKAGYRVPYNLVSIIHVGSYCGLWDNVRIAEKTIEDRRKSGFGKSRPCHALDS